LGEYKWIGGMWGLGFPIKLKERERKGGGDQQEKENSTLFSIPEIMFSSILFISFLIDMQG
jgi:hypothetical protein